MNSGHRALLRYFELHAKCFDQLSRKTARRPSPKRVHELRTTGRRLRAALWMLRHSSAPIGCRRLDRHLKKIGQTLGPDRELDVTIQDAKTYGLDPRELKPLRRRARRRIRRCLGQSRRKRIRAELESAYRKIREQKDLSLEPAYKIMRQELHSWEPERKRTGSRTHLFRVAVKKARYRLEATGHPVERLHALQDTLGEARDLALLQRYLGRRTRVRRDQKALEVRARLLAVPALKSALRRL